MMKKIATVAGAAALLLGSAAPAFATWGWVMPSYDTTNKAYIETDVTAKSNTGDNYQKVYGDGVNEMHTGAAYADASAVTFANLFDGCGCLPTGDLYNRARINTDVYAKAESGDNYQRVSGAMNYQPQVFSFGFGGFHQEQAAKNQLWTGDAAAFGSAFTVANASWMPESE